MFRTMEKNSYPASEESKKNISFIPGNSHQIA